jgi:hypothetical protein
MKTALALLSFSAVLALGCSSMTTSADGLSGGESRNSGAPPSGSGSSSGDGTSEPSPSPGSGGVQAGQLTAGVWDDNLNFDFFTKYTTQSASLPGLALFTAGERQAARDRALAPRTAKGELDILFLFDTTGSMGDELTYLKAETTGIVNTIKSKFPSITPRLALIVYRDQGDDYVTRKFDFTTDLVAYKASLDTQEVGGGGDYEEAVQEGLAAAGSLAWRTGDVARLTFWIADAPHHTQHAQPTRAAIDVAAQKDIHLYPVAASGTDERMENTMRSAAQYTGGRYLFLTDDSGIGNAHKEPSIPCYRVTRFDKAMVRMVESEVTGTRIEPAESEVIRTVGSPVDGKCSLQGGEQVVIY